ncbi:MAG: type I methionyl aminopeptidase [Deltaproteobacteria bacterium]|nr:type I methionyl aminopeptidase [Deltaproteobacteria bacterium]
MIILKSNDEIQKMERASRIVVEVLLKLKEACAPGITTDDLNRMADELIRRLGGIPTFIGYRGYPKALCASVNEEVVHGIPGRRRLKEGDIIGLDLAVTLDGFVGDSALTVPVGKISPETARLVQVTREALQRGVEMVRPGKRVGDVGHAVQSHAEAEGFSVVRDFVGHGIGRNMHEEPQVPNFGKPGTGERLHEGVVLAVEPMINAGSHEVEVLSDGWTVVTKDRKWSAHFEQTVACTADGPRVLTRI